MITNQAILRRITSTNVEIACLACDESHQYMRNESSSRSRHLLEVVLHAEMVIHLSGTLFPLGPRTDGKSTLTMLRGQFMTKPASRGSKWEKAGLADEARKLFSTVHGRMVGWDVKRFRLFISPFHLWRDKGSKYIDNDGNVKWVIERSMQQPIPVTITPSACVHEHSALSLIHAEPVLAHNSGDVDMRKVRQRSTNATIMAWLGTKLWRRYRDANNEARTPREKASKLDNVVSTSLGKEPIS